MKTIQIKCQGATTLPIDVILEFQGKLKKLSKKNLESLKTRIVEDGFIAPFFVWDRGGDYMALDGHGRLAALLSLRQEGYDIPLMPVAFIEAADEKEARARLLSITSQYGEFDSLELADWIGELDEGIAETLRIVDSEISLAVKGDDVGTGGLDDDDPEPIVCPECGHRWLA